MVYIGNPYILFVAYERAAYGELLAAIWLPLLLLFALRERPAVLPLALTVAAVWLTNAPAAVMACYTLGLIGVVNAATERRWPSAVRIVSGAILGAALAAFYVLPAAFERRWVEIQRVIGPGMRVEDSFLFGHTGQAFHDQVLRTASWIAVTMLVTVAVTLSLAWKGRADRRLLIIVSVLSAFILLLMFPISDPFWRHAPELRYLQFPWRWLLVLGVVLALATSSAMDDRFARLKKRGIYAAAAAAVVCLTLLASHFFWQPCDDEDVVSAQVETFRSGTGFEGTDEYTPRDADNSIIQRGLPLVRVVAAPDADQAHSSSDPAQQNPEYQSPPPEPGALVQIQQWSSEHMSFRVQTAVPTYALLKLMDYPAWRVTVNGREIRNRPHRHDGLIVVRLSSGLSAVEVRYAGIPGVFWGRAISLLSLVALLILAMRKKRGPLRLS